MLFDRPSWRYFSGFIFAKFDLESPKFFNVFSWDGDPFCRRIFPQNKATEFVLKRWLAIDFFYFGGRHPNTKELTGLFVADFVL